MKSTTTGSATRVAAYRQRLASGEYRRVESYISAEEKTEIDRVKAELNVNSDTAVAGLIRMGLAAYAQTTQGHAKEASISNPLLRSSMRPEPTPGAADNHNPIAQFFKARSELK